MPEPNKEFVFIDHSNTGGKMPSGGALRLQIRKQAMCDAGQARKQRGDYGQNNLCQYPVYVSQGESSSIFPATTTDEETDPTAANAPIWQLASQWQASVPSQLPSSAYGRLRQDLGFDITELSLPPFHSFARTSVHTLSAQPRQLAKMLFTGVGSYLSFVPSRYEDNPLLRDALFCLAAQSQWALRPQSTISEAAILAAYGSALRRLQKALIDPNQCLEPDVLYATELLGLFEVLKFSRADQWQYHVAGASRIIQNRGPARFNSEYERTLFVSQVGAIFIEAMLNNEACFFNQEQWKPVFESVVLNEVPPFGDRSRRSVDLWRILWPIPRLFKQITELICHQSTPDPGLAMKLTLRAFKIRTDLKKWLEDTEAQLATMPLNPLCKGQAGELIALCLSILVITNRLIVSLCPWTSLAIEQEAQDFSNLILGEVSNKHGERCRSLSQRFKIAVSAIQTRWEWKEAHEVTSVTCCGSNRIARCVLDSSEEWEAECLMGRGVLSDPSQANTVEHYGLVRPQWTGHVPPSMTYRVDEYRSDIEGTGQCVDPIGKGYEQGKLPLTRREDGRSVISKWVFERWCQALGRKTT